MNSLTQTYKKIILLVVILILAISTFLILKIQINPYFKFFFLFLFLILFLSLLTTLEITNSLIENLVFWLIVSLFLSYFYLYGGIILFILAFFKIFSQHNLLKTSLKVPFVKLVNKNYSFFLLAFFLIANFYFYQTFSQQTNLPLTFSIFQKITEKIDVFLSFFQIKFSFKEKISNLMVIFLEKLNLPKQLVSLFSQDILQETVEKALYNSLVNIWQNYNLRKIYLLSFLSIMFIIFYPLLRIFSFLIGYLSLPLYYLFLKIKFVKISFQSLNKEILEL